MRGANTSTDCGPYVVAYRIANSSTNLVSNDGKPDFCTICSSDSHACFTDICSDIKP